MDGGFSVTSLTDLMDCCVWSLSHYRETTLQGIPFGGRQRNFVHEVRIVTSYSTKVVAVSSIFIQQVDIGMLGC